MGVSAVGEPTPRRCLFELVEIPAQLVGAELPQTELATGLLFFNVGVEIGQILFAAAVIAVIYVLKKVVSRLKVELNLETRLQTALSYVVGCTASYWLIRR